MEDKFKRSDRRHRTRTAVNRRIKNWLFFNIHVIENYRMTDEYITTNADRRKYVLEGRGFQFLRTTANPCNCPMCSEFNKFRTYRAKEKLKVLKEINAGIV